jgi:hypothetical protein
MSVTKGNLCLLQVQATVVSLIASFLSVLVYSRNTYTFDLDHVMVLIASNVLTANIACTFLSESFDICFYLQELTSFKLIVIFMIPNRCDHDFDHNHLQSN